MSYLSESKIGSTCAIAGAVLLFVGTYLHPMSADPNDALAAFAEYAASRIWVASHLMQLAGFVLLMSALLVLAHQLEALYRSAWSRIAAGVATAAIAVATMLQAVDGIALKAMVNAWASSPVAEKTAAFHAAFAIRQVEIGLASTLSMLGGLTMTIFGVAMLVGEPYPKWMGIVAIVGGACTMLSGVVMAYTGFSGWSMALNMPSSSILLVWMLALGILMWRRDPSLAAEP
ncbi:MAG: hypothetical protein JWM69_786 [Candidatus Binatus sp.]|nr:hypothetical protein [Candidatus Binatus sp.]